MDHFGRKNDAYSISFLKYCSKGKGIHQNYSNYISEKMGRMGHLGPENDVFS